MKKREGDATWIVHGWLAVGEVTLLSALWKAGKTTLMTHLIRTMESGGDFCGFSVSKTGVIYVTEEAQHRWAERRDSLGLGDSTKFLCRPLLAKPGYDKWCRMIDYLVELQDHYDTSVVVFDTISNLWPVRNETDAAEVNAALMPLHALTVKSGIAIMHHLSKADGKQGTGSRGSGALPSFADTVLEMRRYDPSDANDRRRVITGLGRSDDTPTQTVLELPKDGEYRILKMEAGNGGAPHLQDVIMDVIRSSPGVNADQIRELLGARGRGVGRSTLLNTLNVGTAAHVWIRNGSGAKGDPYTFWPPV
jgi:hypothetical protein